ASAGAGAAWSVITVHPARTVRPPAGGCGRRVPHTTGGVGATAGSLLGGAPEPVVDQGPAHRGRSRQRDLLRLEGGGELLAAEPARLGDLVLLEGEGRGARRPGPAAEQPPRA